MPGTETSSFSNNSLSKATDDSSFTLVSYSRSKTRAATTRTMTTNEQTATANKNQAPKKQATRNPNTASMQLVTSWQFKEFQRIIVPIIEKITTDASNPPEHPFTQRWMAVERGPHSILPSSTFHAVKKVLNLKDIHKYRRFLRTAPQIEKYIMFGEPNPSGTGFYYKVIDDETQEKMGRNNEIGALVDNVGNQERDISNTESTTVVASTASNKNGSFTQDDLKEPEEELADLVGTNESITTTGTIHKVCYGGHDDFQALLQDIWPYIEKFMQTYPDHDHTKQWEKWRASGLTSTLDLRTFKIIIGIETLDQLYVVLRESPALQEHFDMVWDHKILYRPKPPVPVLLTATTDRTVPRRYTIKNLNDLDVEFCIFHLNIFTEIQEWSKAHKDKQDAKWLQWQKWIFSGLKPIQPTKEIRKIMGVNTIIEYIQKVQPYPPFQEKFSLHDTEDNQVVKYSYTCASRDHSDFKIDFVHFASYFDINISQMALRMQDFKTKIEGCEYTLKNFFSQQKQNLTSMTNATMEQHERIFQNKIDEITNHKLEQVHHTLEEKLDRFLEQKLTYIEQIIDVKLGTILNEKMKQFQMQATNMVDEMLQDIYQSADDGHDAINRHLQQQVNTFLETIKEHRQQMEQTVIKQSQYQQINPDIRNISPVSPATHTNRFAHGTTGGGFRRSPEHLETTTSSLPDASRFRNSNVSPQDVRNQPISKPQPLPTTVRTRYSPQLLPPINHDQALKRAKIQFTGLGDIFVFYTQLLNAMEQFGIYLLPLKQVKYQQSLCPTHHCGIEIDSYRHQAMASTLYQKLQSTEVIPMEHTSIRNIINRFAEANDGYQVLYAMLELVHPAMQTDAVILPPKSNECGEDIHVYAQKFDSWLRYEAYANRPYSPREQVNKFINELSPHFAPAISRVRRLLDAWSPFNVIAPEVLKITALPNTIERFMDEELGQGGSHVRKVTTDKRNRTGQRGTRPVPIDTTTKDSKDEYCTLDTLQATAFLWLS